MNDLCNRLIDKSRSEPIYLQIEDSIMDSVKRGEIKKDGKLPSEDALSKIYKVSRTTIRQTMSLLEQKGIILKIPGKGTFLKNLEPEIKEPSESAINNIGIYIPSNISRQHPFFLELIENMQSQADVMDLTINIFTDISKIYEKNFSGIIFISRVPLEILLELEKKSVPFVLIHDHSETYGREFPCVLFDSVDAIFRITEHLIKLDHKRIAFFTGVLNGVLKGEGSRKKLKGYTAALDAFQIPCDPLLIKECDFDDGTTIKMLDEVLALEEPPTAIISCDDIGAVITINNLLSKGINVPKEIAVVGLGDFKINSMCSIPLTTYRFPADKIGAKAVFLLHQIKNALPCEKNIKIKGELVLRKSCGFH